MEEAQSLVEEKVARGREREYRGEEKEETVGPGGGLPSYRRDPAKILRDLSLLLQVGLAYFSSAFDQVLQSRQIEPREMANRPNRRSPDAEKLVIHTRRTRRKDRQRISFFRELIKITNCECKIRYKMYIFFLSFHFFRK